MRIPFNVFIRSLLALCLALSSMGCNMIPHNLQPHRLWRLNRGGSSARQNPYFSVPDHIQHPGQTAGDSSAPSVELGESVPIDEALE